MLHTMKMATLALGFGISGSEEIVRPDIFPDDTSNEVRVMDTAVVSEIVDVPVMALGGRDYYSVEISITENPNATDDGVALYLAGFNHCATTTYEEGLIAQVVDDPNIHYHVTVSWPGHCFSSWPGFYEEVGISEYRNALEQVIRYCEKNMMMPSHVIGHSLAALILLTGEYGITNMLTIAAVPPDPYPWEFAMNKKTGGAWFSPLFWNMSTALQWQRGLGWVFEPHSTQQMAYLYMRDAEGNPAEPLSEELLALLADVMNPDPRLVGFEMGRLDIDGKGEPYNLFACYPGECNLTMVALDNDFFMSPQEECNVFKAYTEGADCTAANGFHLLESTSTDVMHHEAVLTSPSAFKSVLTEFFSHR